MSKCLNFYISKFLTIKIILKKEKKIDIQYAFR